MLEIVGVLEVGYFFLVEGGPQLEGTGVGELEWGKLDGRLL